MKAKISRLKKRLKEISATHESVALWFSGGADSLLLLEVLLSAKQNFGILRFEDGLTRQQKAFGDAVIIAKKLQVFSYPHKRFFQIGDRSNVALVSHYALSAQTEFTLVRDLVDGKQCSLEMDFKISRRADAPVEFEAHISGSRADDTHWSLKNVIPAKEWRTGDKNFYAPLYEWTRAEVIEGLKSFGIDYTEPPDELNTGNIAACFECLKGNKGGTVYCPKSGAMIPTVEWDGAGNTELFRKSVMGD